MKKPKPLQVFFTLSLFIKAFDGAFELIGGLVFVILKKEHIINMISRFFNYNIFHIPNEVVNKWVTTFSDAFTTSTKAFIASVLIGNGVIKIVLATTLLMKKYAAFPTSIIFLLLLLIYQTVQIFYTPSLFLYLMNCFDALVIYVIWREYLRLKETKGFRKKQKSR